MLSIQSLIEQIEPKVNKGAINKFLHMQKKNLVYTSFDGDYMNFLPQMLDYVKSRGKIAINPESTLGYYISTVTYDGDKRLVMRDCIQTELLCDEMWVFSPTNNHIPEGVFAEMQVWIQRKNTGVTIIPFFEASNLTVSLDSTRSISCFTRSAEEVCEIINKREHAYIQDIRDKLFKDDRFFEHPTSYIVANFLNYKHIDWARVYCYNNDLLPVSPQNIMPFSIYCNDLSDYYINRLTLLNKCDRLLFFTNLNNVEFEIANLDSFSCTELYYWYTYRDRDLIEIVEWKTAEVPKYSKSEKWALTKIEQLEVTGVKKKDANEYENIRSAVEIYEREIQNRYNILKGELLDEKARELILSDSNAFLFGLISDQSVKAELAWSLPFNLKQRMGGFDVHELANVDASVIEHHIKEKPALHRYPAHIAKYIQEASKRLVELYDGLASNIWSHGETAAKIVERLEEFKGISHKKAALGCLLLVRDLGVNIADKENINLAYDVHIRRICLRTGLCKLDTLEEITNFGKRVFPEFPGRLTSTFWAIGRDICRPAEPDCKQCPLSQICHKVL